jgi:hypothetical protein
VSQDKTLGARAAVRVFAGPSCTISAKFFDSRREILGGLLIISGSGGGGLKAERRPWHGAIEVPVGFERTGRWREQFKAELDDDGSSCSWYHSLGSGRGGVDVCDKQSHWR